MRLSHIRSLELVSLHYFLHNFWRKIFFLWYCINLPTFIVWLPLLCETLGNMCIVTTQIVRLNVSFWSSRFFNMSKKSRQKFKNLENEKSFKGEIKSTSHHFRMDFIEGNFFGRWEPDFNIANDIPLENLLYDLQNSNRSIEFNKRCVFQRYLRLKYNWNF